MRDVLRVGVVGAGHMGGYHVAVLSEIPEANLTAVCDLDSHRARELADRYGAEAFSDPADLIGRVDAVTIAVPTLRHFEVSRAFLESGVHALVEKPICPTMEEALALFDLAARNSVALHIGHVERFNAAVQELGKIVDGPMLIECRRLGPFTPRAGEDGVVLDLMIHDLDIVLRLVDEEVELLSATGASVLSEREDVANVQICFAGGCVANLTSSRVTQNKIRTLSVSQPDAFITLDYADQELRIHRQAMSERHLTRDEFKYREQFQMERVFVHKDNPLKLELRHFLRAAQAAEVVREPEKELRSLDVAIRVVEMLKRSIPSMP